ncbi:histidinol-phosphate transaminase [Catenovulum sp. SX2]|uniref:histidinol-phosphate transaminase n=1 Tax=Catenovulum sp. SX2 TaxID=3398614 RepID=UPI003F8576E7
MANLSVFEQVHPWIKQIRAFPAAAETAPPELQLKMDANENLFPISAFVQARVIRSAGHLNYYPDGTASNLKRVLADMQQLTPEHYLLGNGSNEILDIVIRSFCGPGDEVLFSQHSFAAYPLLAKTVGATPVAAPSVNFAHNLPNITEAITDKTKVILLANPNNPTGSCFGGEEFVQFMAVVPKHVLVVLDEAYIEYSATAQNINSTQLINQHDNLLITRTFSKAYGLAALRIGYAITNPQLVEILNKMRQPFNANRLALVAAQAALEDQQHLKFCVEQTRLGYEYLIRELNKLNIEFIRSESNFICLKLTNCAAVVQQLAEYGVMVGYLAGYQMPDYIRVTIGGSEHNLKFINALRRVL